MIKQVRLSNILQQHEKFVLLRLCNKVITVIVVEMIMYLDPRGDLVHRERQVLEQIYHRGHHLVDPQLLLNENKNDKLREDHDEEVEVHLLGRIHLVLVDEVVRLEILEREVV